jgi:uncharacterized protein
MFGKTLLVIGSLLHLYIFWRAASIPFLRRHISRKIIYGAGLLIWAIFFTGRIMGHGHVGLPAVLLELFSMTWLALLILLSLSLLAVEIITGFGFLFPRLAPRLRGWALVVGLALSVIGTIQGLRPPVINRYEVHLAGLPPERDGTVLVAMSDLHLGTLLGKRWLEARVSQVQSLDPDIVILLGDIFEWYGQSEDNLPEVLSRLSAPLGVWAVMGNHESYGGREHGADFIEQANIPILRNRWKEICPGLILAGVDDLTIASRFERGKDLIAQSLAGRPSGAAILLSHSPLYADTAAQAGANLMLCGHTHGGQIWPVGYLTRLRYPMLEGRYDAGSMPVIVTRGAGTWGPRMRLWKPGEILHVTLRSKK